MSDVLTAEAAVRNYFLFREDPTQLIDPSQIKRLEQEAVAAKDPIDKLKALAGLTRARTVDAHTYERAFVQHAREWAEQNDIPPTVFKELGIPDTVLRAAGFGRRTKAATAPDVRSRSVSAKAIQAHIIGQPKERFTLADLANNIGGSPMTIRKAVDELVKAGTIVKLGPTPSWSGPGRAPIQFVKS